MERRQYKVTVKAPKQRVWETLWGDQTYPQWTAPFSEGSRAESDWKEGSKVRFLNSENEGMIALITEKRENEVMSFKHIGMIDKQGREDFESEEVRTWAGAVEKYVLRQDGDLTQVLVEMDVDQKYAAHFEEIWPKALHKLKEIAETNNTSKSTL